MEATFCHRRADRSKRPKVSPALCPPQLAASVEQLRRQHPTWGGHKLRRRLHDLGHKVVPAASTCTAVLRRAGLLETRASEVQPPWQRFERAQPNELWQTDFKGHFPTQDGRRCHPLTVLDDHSRFNVVLAASADEKGATVQAALAAAFATYGLPEALLCDNGPPWGSAEPVCPYTSLGVWLLRQGVRVLHGRPYHPQTQGKDERFHRTLKADLLSQHTWRDLAHCAEQFSRFRHEYNCERPHQALHGDTPISRYRPSPRPAPTALPPIEYDLPQIRHVHAQGAIMFHHQSWYVGRAFAGLPVGLRPSAQPVGQWEVFFAYHHLGWIDLRLPKVPKHTLRSIYANPP